MDMVMKIGDRVHTPDGDGVIVDVVDYSRLKEKRYAIRLYRPETEIAVNPLYYWEKEIDTIKNVS